MAHPLEGHRVRAALFIVLAAIFLIGYSPLADAFLLPAVYGVCVIVILLALPLKRWEDVALAAVFSLALALGHWQFPGVDPTTLLLRTAAISAFVLLHLVLLIGPWSWQSRFVMRLVKHRRHMGVTVFLLGLLHYALILRTYYGGDVKSLLAGGPVVLLGYTALFIFFAMAVISRDHAQRHISEAWWQRIHVGWLLGYAAFVLVAVSFQQRPYPAWIPVVAAGVVLLGVFLVRSPWSLRLFRPFFGWKQLHRMVYAAYTALIIHVSLVADTYGVDWVLPTVIGAAGVVLASHVYGHVAKYCADRFARERVTKLGKEMALQGKRYVGIARVDEFVPGVGQKFFVEGRPLAVFRVGERYVAVSNTCLHQQGPLSRGWVDKEGFIVCPWHEWQYSTKDGCGPPQWRKECIPRYETEVKDGVVFVAMERAPLPPDVPIPAKAAGEL